MPSGWFLHCAEDLLLERVDHGNNWCRRIIVRRCQYGSVSYQCHLAICPKISLTVHEEKKIHKQIRCGNWPTCISPEFCHFPHYVPFLWNELVWRPNSASMAADERWFFGCFPGWSKNHRNHRNIVSSNMCEDDSTQKNVVKNNIHSVKLKLMKMCGWKTIFLLQRQLGATVVLIRQVPSGKLR